MAGKVTRKKRSKTPAPGITANLTATEEDDSVTAQASVEYSCTEEPDRLTSRLVTSQVGHELLAEIESLQQRRKLPPRGYARLYREAREILQRHPEYGPKLVLRELEKVGVVRPTKKRVGAQEVLRWKDDRGVAKATSYHQFESRIGEIRRTLEKK